MSVKIISIYDFVRVPFHGSYMNCPVERIHLTDEDLRKIVLSPKMPPHIYVHNPKNPTEKVLITRENFEKSAEELFGEKPVVPATPVVEEKVEPIKVDVPPMVKEALKEVEEVLNEAPAEEVIEETTDEVVETIINEPVVEDDVVNDEVVEENEDLTTEDVVDTIVETEDSVDEEEVETVANESAQLIGD